MSAELANETYRNLNIRVIGNGPYHADISRKDGRFVDNTEWYCSADQAVAAAKALIDYHLPPNMDAAAKVVDDIFSRLGLR